MLKQLLTITTFMLIEFVSAAKANDLKLSSSPSKSSPPWLAWGDLRGHIEPCGCSPATDLGGIQRIAATIQREHTMNGSRFPVLVLGNLLAEDSDSDKDDVILDALATMPSTAILFNTLEQNKAAKIAAWQKNRKEQLPWLWSNPNKTKQLEVKEWISNPQLTIMGYVTGGEAYGPALATRWKKVLASQPGFKVLLFAGKNQELRAISQDSLFDDIIVANRTPFKTEPSPIEKDEPGRLLVLERYYSVPSFGQGLLRGGALRTSGNSGSNTKTPSLFGHNEAKSTTTSASKITTFTPTSASGIVTWLSRDFEGDSTAQAVVKAYHSKQAEAFAAKRQARLALLKDTPYAGAQACQTCHPAAYQTWQASRHAHALPTLQRVGKDQVEECVTCHVLGLDKPGGFVSATDTPQFAGVQCETCHGPRLAHSRNPTQPIPATQRLDAKTVCLSCHKTPHTYQFQFDAYWPKIKHGKG